MSARSLTCQELIEFLAAYVEDDLPADERSRFDAHLSICPHCVDYLRGYREAIRLGQASFAEPAVVHDEVPSELVAAILAARKR